MFIIEENWWKIIIGISLIKADRMRIKLVGQEQ